MPRKTRTDRSILHLRDVRRRLVLQMESAERLIKVLDEVLLELERASPDPKAEAIAEEQRPPLPRPGQPMVRAAAAAVQSRRPEAAPQPTKRPAPPANGDDAARARRWDLAKEIAAVRGLPAASRESGIPYQTLYSASRKQRWDVKLIPATERRRLKPLDTRRAPKLKAGQVWCRKCAAPTSLSGGNCRLCGNPVRQFAAEPADA